MIKDKLIDFVFEYRANNGLLSKCGIFLQETKDHKMLCIATELEENTGPSITNSCEFLAMEICRQREINVLDFILIERYSKRKDGISLVIFDINMELGAKTFYNPHWKRLDNFIIEEVLLGNLPSDAIIKNVIDKKENKEKEINKKSLNILDVNGAKKNIDDLEVYGDGDTFRLLCKASSKKEGWMKSTKVCNVQGGCIVQVTTQQRNADFTYSISEALTFVPGNHIDIDADPRVITGSYFQKEDNKNYLKVLKESEILDVYKNIVNENEITFKDIIKIENKLKDMGYTII